jgi:hypothetical protein
VITRGQRVLHGTIAALFSTFVAAFSHAVSGGGAPGVLALTLALAFSIVLCTLLSPRRASPLRLGLSVVLSQTVFHTLFSLFGPLSGTMNGSHSGVGLALADVLRSGHHGAVTIEPGVVALGQAGHSMATPDAAMIAGHVFAAVVTFLALHRSERSLSGLLRAATIALGRLLVTRLPQQIVDPLIITMGQVDRVQIRPVLIFLAPIHRRRGPPDAYRLALSPLG